MKVCTANRAVGYATSSYVKSVSTLLFFKQTVGYLFVLESPKCIILESGAAIDARRIHWFLSRASSDSAGTSAGSWILEDLGRRMRESICSAV